MIVGGVGVSGNAFVDNAEKRSWLNKNFNALITDRESSAVAQVCSVNGVPFIVFRSASDLAGGSGPSTARDELEEFSKIAAFNASILVIKLMESL
jgi:adenosylhomocysteine nucleosidase